MTGMGPPPPQGAAALGAPPHHPDRAPCCVLCGAADVRPFALVGATRYWRCGHCRLTFMDAAHRLSRQDEHAEYLLHENDPADPRYRTFLSRLTVHLLSRLPRGARGLDYGCGPGPTIQVLMGEAGFEVKNYDPLFAPDEAVLRGSYDFITCTEVVEHFHAPGSEFERLDALLSPGGWLGVMTAMLDDDSRFAHWRYRRDPTHVAFYKPVTFDLLAQRRGWHVEHPAPGVVLFRKTG